MSNVRARNDGFIILPLFLLAILRTQGKKIQTSVEQDLLLWPRQGCVGAHCGLLVVIIHLQLNPEH